MSSYTFDPIAGLARLGAEEAERLWHQAVDGLNLGADDAAAVYYVQAPLTAGYPDDVLMRIIVQDIPAASGLPYRYLAWLDGNMDDEDSDDIFVTGQLGLLELLARYGPFLAQPLGDAAARDRADAVRRLRRKAAA